VSRRTTDALVERILDLVVVCRLEPIPRADLARRWGITPRAVSNVIDRAHNLFGVMVAHRRDEGYVILDTGIIDLRKLRARRAA
jgi:hypothetical protein